MHLITLLLLINQAHARQPCVFGLVGEDKSRKNTELLMNSISKGLSERKVVDTIEKSVSVITGVPSAVKKIEVTSQQVYRHYVSTGLSEIISQAELKAGNLPYIITGGGGSRKFYDSLTGVFLTKPEFQPGEVGLENRDDYDFVDFALHPNTGMLQIEDKILLIPGSPKNPEWIMTRYKKWLAGKYEPASGELEIFEKMKSSQLEEISIPIKILQYRKNGTLTKLND